MSIGSTATPVAGGPDAAYLRPPELASPMPPERDSTHTRILAVVRRIPSGRVATYGQVAQLAGLPRHARLVGYALAALPSATAVPWHRVLNARGEVSLRREGIGPSVQQRLLLEREGVRFDAAGRVPLTVHGWRPRARAARAAER